MDHQKRKGGSEKKLVKFNKDWNNTVGLKCVYTNVDSLSNKRDELNLLIADEHPEIIGLAEIKPKNLCVGGYDEGEVQIDDRKGSGIVCREGSGEQAVGSRGRGSVDCSM